MLTAPSAVRHAERLARSAFSRLDSKAALLPVPRSVNPSASLGDLILQAAQTAQEQRPESAFATLERDVAKSLAEAETVIESARAEAGRLLDAVLALKNDAAPPAGADPAIAMAISALQRAKQTGRDSDALCEGLETDLIRALSDLSEEAGTLDRLNSTLAVAISRKRHEYYERCYSATHDRHYSDLAQAAEGAYRKAKASFDRQYAPIQQAKRKARAERRGGVR